MQAFLLPENMGIFVIRSTFCYTIILEKEGVIDVI